MTNPSRVQVETLLSHLEELWSNLDELFSGLGPEGWATPHGKDWVYADLPFHLAYFDREMVAYPLQQGPSMPANEQTSIPTIDAINAWNEENFAQRPNDQTVEQSLEGMRANRDIIRQEAAKLTDADLGRLCWMPLAGMGWIPAGFILAGCRQHTWGEFIQLRLLMGRETPASSAPVTHGALEAYMGLMPWALNRDAAATADFTLVMAFTQPGVGPWTIHVADGDCTISSGGTEEADLTITQSPESWAKTWYHLHDPAEAMQSGEIQVSNFEALGTFATLFPPPA